MCYRYFLLFKTHLYTCIVNVLIIEIHICTFQVDYMREVSLKSHIKWGRKQTFNIICSQHGRTHRPTDQQIRTYIHTPLKFCLRGYNKTHEFDDFFLEAFSLAILTGSVFSRRYLVPVVINTFLRLWQT